MNEIVKSDRLESLTARERAAYKCSIDRKEPFLSPVTADQLYSLFETGRSCEEIQALNKGISLGIVVRARIDFEWDDRRDAHFEALRLQARTYAQNLTLESVAFLGDLLNAFHKHDRAKFQRFIQTGNAEEFAGALLLTSANLKTYQGLLDMVMKITGQDSTKTQNIHGVVEHHHTVDSPIPQAARPLTPEEAVAVIATVVPKKG